MDGNINKKEKLFKTKELKKLKNFSLNKLYNTEKELKKHLTENEILELLKKGILEDETFN